MSLFSILAGNMYLWLGLAIVCAVISVGIIVSGINKVRKAGFEGALDMLSEHPDLVAKSGVKTWLTLRGIYLITGFFWILFIISAILNAALWIKHS